MIKWLAICFYFLLLSACESEHITENPLEKLCANQSMDITLQCLNALPKEDIMAIPAVRSYLQKHKVYISLTSSPARLKDAIWALKTLDLTYIEKIFLTLPEKYQNKESYTDIPDAILNFPKLEIIGQDKRDIGPATKIIYALEHVGQFDADAIVISVDDDTGLPHGGISQLIKHAILFPDAVIGGSGRYASIFGIDYANSWPKDDMTNRQPFCGKGPESYCNILEGYKGVAYKPRLVNTKLITKLATTSRSCLTSDDLVISYVLASQNVERIRISNAFYNQVNQFSFGFEGDALHRVSTSKQDYGDGWTPRFSWAGLVGSEMTANRYQRCAHELSKMEGAK